MSALELICIGHKKPLFEVAQPFRMLAPVPLDMPNVELIPDNVWGEQYDGRVLSEFLQLFVLADQLDGSDDEPIYLFQYRKFIVSASTRLTGPMANYCRTCGPPEAGKVFPSAEVLAPLKGPITGQVVTLDVAQQYSNSHSASDFAGFCMALRDSGLFSSAEVTEFRLAQRLIPSATLGIFPASTLVRHLSLMRKVWEVYRDHYYVPRDGYQVRVGGFLMERLHSFLILRDRAQGEAPPEQWQRVLVAP